MVCYLLQPTTVKGKPMSMFPPPVKSDDSPVSPTKRREDINADVNRFLALLLPAINPPTDDGQLLMSHNQVSTVEPLSRGMVTGHMQVDRLEIHASDGACYTLTRSGPASVKPDTAYLSRWGVPALDENAPAEVQQWSSAN